ncbi:hypothetical protein [Streptomyces sp. PT12]|uniref:hypothetical protein n=1 Tax=Streptomyces sp. PT12 TaxID=1510197 RepID=UPI0011BE32E2|nr:hypothetical protein [Streptomyces sp. PT12]
MDQVLAAVLGALVGAVATWAGAYLNSSSSERLNKRQARRESYLALLRAYDRFLEQAQVFCDSLYKGDYRPEQFDSQLDEPIKKFNEIRVCASVVTLDGPPPICEEANRLVNDAYNYLSYCHQARSLITETNPQVSPERVDFLRLRYLWLASSLYSFRENASRYV